MRDGGGVFDRCLGAGFARPGGRSTLLTRQLSQWNLHKQTFGKYGNNLPNSLIERGSGIKLIRISESLGKLGYSYFLPSSNNLNDFGSI